MIKRKLKDGSSVLTFFATRTIGEVEHWLNEEGSFHRDNGLPAILGENGYEGYYTNGVLHSERYTNDT